MSPKCRTNLEDDSHPIADNDSAQMQQQNIILTEQDQ